MTTTTAGTPGAPPHPSAGVRSWRGGPRRSTCRDPVVLAQGSGALAPSSPFFLSPLSIPLYSGELSQPTRPLDPTSGQTRFHTIVIGRACRGRGISLQSTGLRTHQETVSLSPDFCCLSPVPRHPTRFPPTRQGIREGVHPGYQYYRVHLFA